MEIDGHSAGMADTTKVAPPDTRVENASLHGRAVIPRSEPASKISKVLRRSNSIHSKIVLVDFLCISWATGGAQIARFGISDGSLDIGDNHQAPYTAVSALIIVAWWAVLGARGSRDRRVLGYGPEEYKRVTSATLWLFGAVAIFSYVFQLDTARGYVAIALPLGVLSLLIGRWTLRMALVAARKRGYGLQRIMLIGGPDTTAHLQRQLSGHPEAGYCPVAAYLPGASKSQTTIANGTLPVLGTGMHVDDVIAAIDGLGATTVAITAGAPFDPTTLRQLGWRLAARHIGMIMAPALTDVAGPRIHTQPVAGLPLIHVTTPELDGTKSTVKRSFDIITSLLLVSLLALPVLIVAVLIRIDSPGPVFFRQTRVGRAGAPFSMFKFRSMVVDAEESIDRLRWRNEGSGPLFKLKEDPRITRVGRTIRRYSIDEIPQLINVLRGEMSLVGPRPPLLSEVDAYDDDVNRRFLVKPGITGLWQVSGRSDLPWEEAVRLDLYYVENWSLTQDLMILLRTLRVVLAKEGAY